MEAPDEPVRPPKRTAMALVKWLVGDERVRFVLVGGFNTVFGYALFVGFEVALGAHTGYLVSLYAAFVIATAVAFILHRHFTYRVTGTGNIAVDFLRFMGVYLISLLINTAALPLLVEVVGIPVLIAQALIVVITTLVSYFGHKLFSFRRAKVKIGSSGVDPEHP